MGRGRLARLGECARSKTEKFISGPHARQPASREKSPRFQVRFVEIRGDNHLTRRLAGYWRSRIRSDALGQFFGEQVASQPAMDLGEGFSAGGIAFLLIPLNMLRAGSAENPQGEC